MLRTSIVAAVLIIGLPVQAQQPGNALSTCLADSTSGKDRKDLAKWIFLAMAAHPEMKPHANVSAETMDESSRTMAALVTRLLADSCVSETRAVMSTGGPQSLPLAFQSLGQLAMQELMTDKAVQDSMSLFQRYLDQQRLNEALSGK